MEKGERIGLGRTAEVYGWGEDRALKLFFAHVSPRVVEAEFNLTRLAGAAGMPAPAAESLVEVDGRPGILLERLDGPSMLKVLSAQPWQVIAYSRLLGELHARVHLCRTPVGIRSQREQIERGIDAARALPADRKAAARAALAELPGGDSLCHGDFHPDNILITSRGPVIIDWMNATGGEPLGDVCRTSLLLLTGGLPPDSPAHLLVLTRLMRRLMETSYRSRYLQLHPARPEQIDAWRLPLMAARLREVEAYPREMQALLKSIQVD